MAIDDMILHYNFSEGSGATVYDRSGNGNDGTMQDSQELTWVAGEDWLEFSGLNSTVLFPALNIFHDAHSFTLSAHLKFDYLDEMGIICPRGDAYVSFWTDGNNNLSLDFSLSPQVQSSNIEASKWVHVVAVYDAAGAAYLYINGTEVGNNTDTQSITPNDANNRVGGRGEFSEFKGQMNDIRIYDRNLSASEVSNLWAALPDYSNEKKASVDIQLDKNTTAIAGRTRGGVSDIQAATDLLGDIEGVLSGEVSVSLDPNLIGTISLGDQPISIRGAAGSLVAGETAWGATVTSGTAKYGDSNIQLQSEFTATIERIRGAISDIQSALAIESDIFEQITADTSIDITLDTAATAETKRGGLSETIISLDLSGIMGVEGKKQARWGASTPWGETAFSGVLGQLTVEVFSNISVESTLEGLASRLRDVQSAVEFAADIASTGSRLRTALSETSLNTSIEAIDIRKRYSSSSPAISLTFSAVPSSTISPEADITFDFGTDISAGAIRNAVGTTEIAYDFIADLFKQAVADISLSADLTTEVLRKRFPSSDIVIILDLEGELTPRTVLMEFAGSFAPGDSIKIDTEDMTITDPNTGENLRPDFTVNDWWKILPGEAVLTWRDEETGRTVGITIKKEDRTI